MDMGALAVAHHHQHRDRTIRLASDKRSLWEVGDENAPTLACGKLLSD